MAGEKITYVVTTSHTVPKIVPRANMADKQHAGGCSQVDGEHKN
jgi:hypothetical protein